MEYLQTKVLGGMMDELLEEFEPMHVLDQLVQKNIVDTEGEKQIKARKSRKERVMTTKSTLAYKHDDDRWLLRFAEVLEVSVRHKTLGEKLKKETERVIKEIEDLQELYSVSEKKTIPTYINLLHVATAIQESDARKLLKHFQVPYTNSDDLGKTLVKFLLNDKKSMLRLNEACSKYKLKYLQDINAKHDTILSFPELQGNLLVELPASRSNKKVSLLGSGTLWESSLIPKETSIKLYVFFRGEYDIHVVKLCNKAKSLRLRIESKRSLDKLLEENEAGVFGTNVAKLVYKSVNGSESTPNIRLDFEKSKLNNIRKELSTVGDTSSLSACSSLASFEAGYNEAQSTFDYLDMMDRLIQAINKSDITVLCAYLKIPSVDKILGSKNPRRNFIHVCRQRKIWTSKDTSRLVEAVRSNKLTHLENIVTGKNNDMSLWPEVTVKITPRKPYDATFTKFKQFMLRRKGDAKSKVEKEVGLNLLFKLSTAESMGKLKKDIDSGRFLQELLRIYKDETGDHTLKILKAERESIKLAYDENQFKELVQYVANEEKSRQHTFDYLDMMDRLIETMDVSDIDQLCKYFNMDPKSSERIEGSTNPKREFILVCRRKMIWTRENTSRLLDAVKSTQLTRLQIIIEDFNDMSLCPEVTLMMKSNSPSGAMAEFEEFLLSSKKRLDTEFRREFKVHLVDCEKGSFIFRLKVPSKDSLDQLIGDIHSGRLLKKLITMYNERTKKEATILEDGKLSIKLSYDTKEVKDASNVFKQTNFTIKDQWKRALMRLQTLMEEDFDPFSLMEILTSNGTLTSTEVDALNATAKRKQRVRLFISFLETKEETAFKSFRLALEGCSYYEELAKGLDSEVKGYLLSGVTEDMTGGSQVSGKTDEISQQCSTEEIDFDIFLESSGNWNIVRAPTRRCVEEEQMVTSVSTQKRFKTTKEVEELAEKGGIYPGTTSNVGEKMSEVMSKMAMHKEKRQTLDRTLEILTMDLDVMDAIIHLRSKEILKEIDEEIINAMDTEQEKVSEFVRIIKKRGEKAYLVFREYLGVCQGSEHLAEEMDKNLRAVEQELQGLTIQADGMKQIERWKALEEKFYCFSCKYDNIGKYIDIPEEINILLVGKTGSGKSATGNTLIGEPYFTANDTSASVTKTISTKNLKEDRYNITVIDTPGLFDTANDFQNEDLVLEIAKTVITFERGIHLLLLVLSSTARFTQEEQNTINAIEKILGKSVYQNCLVVMTYAGAKFGSKDKQSLRQYVTKERKDGGMFAGLLKHVSNRIIAVENCFEDVFLTEKHRQKLLSCLAQMIHDNKGSVYSNKTFKKAKARIDLQEKERERRVTRETDLTFMKTKLREFLLQKYLTHLTENQLDNIVANVRKETTNIMIRSGVKQLECITSDDVITYVENFIGENGVLIAKLKDVKIQEAKQKQEYEDTKLRLEREETINKMHSIVLPLVSNYLKQQSKQTLEKIIQEKQLPDECSITLFAKLKSYKMNFDIQYIEKFIKATFFENPTQIQGYIVGKVLKESLEEKSKQLKQVQREQELNGMMETLKKNLYTSLEGKTDEELDDLKTDLTDMCDSGPGNWKTLFTDLLGSQIEGSDISITEVSSLFLQQNNNLLQSVLGILFEKQEQQREAKRLQKMEQLKNSAFEIISLEIKEKLKSYLTGKTISDLVKVEAQIGRGEVPSDIFDEVYKQLTKAQKDSLTSVEIKTEILKQIKEQSEIIEKFKAEVNTCFAGSTEVRIKERGIVNISNVRVNDEILVFDENGNLFYDMVYLISHAREDENITFVRLQTSSDNDLLISPGHLLPVGSLGSNVAAKDVSLGNVIFTLQDGVMMPDKVTSKTYELCRGAYCPMTMHGTVVVNDVAASCYTTFFPSPLAHALLSPIRVLFSYLPLSLFNRLLPYDTEEGMPVLLLKCRSIVTMWRSFVDKE